MVFVDLVSKEAESHLASILMGASVLKNFFVCFLVRGIQSISAWGIW